MAGYDPKRPRPSVSDDDALAPVDAILDATTGQVPVVVVEPAGGAAQESVPESEPVVAQPDAISATRSRGVSPTR